MVKVGSGVQVNIKQNNLPGKWYVRDAIPET